MEKLVDRDGDVKEKNTAWGEICTGKILDSFSFGHGW